MNHRKLTVLSLAAAAFALPALSHANTLWHPAASEAGVTSYPAHFASNKSRADVAAEYELARKSGALPRGEQEAAPIVASSDPGKTRQQVIDEFNRETPAERRARLELQTGGA
jgi:hypothetical protein